MSMQVTLTLTNQVMADWAVCVTKANIRPLQLCMLLLLPLGLWIGQQAGLTIANQDALQTLHLSCKDAGEALYAFLRNSDKSRN